MILRRVVILSAVLVLVAASAYCADAVMGRYDANQSSYTSERLDLPLALLWEFTGNDYDDNPAAPAVAAGVCYFACGDRIYAIDIETGSLKWKYPSDQGLGGKVKGAPAVADGYIYFGAGDGNLYCLDAATGAFRWAYQTRGAIRCAPVISEGDIYVTSDDNSLYAIETVSGELDWTLKARDDFASGTPVGMGVVVAACMDGNMYGINASTGNVSWMSRLPLAPTDSSPVITENMVVMAVGSQMFGLSVRSGQQRWATRLPADIAATPAVAGNSIYVPCQDRNLYAYTVTGRKITLKWTAPADLGTKPLSSPTVAFDTVYVTGSRGVVAAYSALDGSLKWRYIVTPSAVTTPKSLFADAASSPVVAAGSLFVLTDDGVGRRFTPTSPDQTVPVMLNNKPANGVAMSGAPPIKVSAVLYDIGSGVDFSSAAVYLDDQPKEHKVDVLTSTISYKTETGVEGKPVPDLTDGVHTVTITAKDYKGNLLSKQWYFVADGSLPRPRRAVAVGTGTKKGPDTGTPDKGSRTPRRRVPGGGNQEPPNIETPPPPPMPPAMPPAPGTPTGPGAPPAPTTTPADQGDAEVPEAAPGPF